VLFAIAELLVSFVSEWILTAAMLFKTVSFHLDSLGLIVAETKFSSVL